MLTRQREFVADASHELRTPLTSVLANLDLLADELEGEQAETAEAALRATRRMRRLVGDLLLLARADAERSRAAPADRPGRGPDRGGGRARPGGRGPRALDRRPAAPWSPGVRDDLHRLTLNLLENAVRHTPPGTHIRARVDAPTGPPPGRRGRRSRDPAGARAPRVRPLRPRRRRRRPRLRPRPLDRPSGRRVPRRVGPPRAPRRAARHAVRDLDPDRSRGRSAGRRREPHWRRTARNGPPAPRRPKLRPRRRPAAPSGGGAAGRRRTPPDRRAAPAGAGRSRARRRWRPSQRSLDLGPDVLDQTRRPAR